MVDFRMNWTKAPRDALSIIFVIVSLQPCSHGARIGNLLPISTWGTL
jgi:hypothetical protein